MSHRSSLMLLLSVTLVVSQAIAQGASTASGVVAKAGDMFITEKEFVERFEMIPGLQRNRSGRIEEAKLELLYSLIAEKLLAQEAHDRKLDKDSTFQASFEEVKKSLARDQLYREEVSGKVQVTPTEVREGIARALKEVLVAFLYCDRKSDAEFLRKQIATEQEFDTMQIDTSIQAVRDTATIIWSDATPAIEDAAYTLKRGAISPVIQAGRGYYILKVEHTQKNVFYSSLQTDVLRERVEDRIRQRKEEARLNEFVASTLKNKIGYSRPKALEEVVASLKQVYATVPVTGKVALSDTMLAQVRSSCERHLNDTLCVAGNVVWTVGEIVDRLYTKGVSFDSTTVRSIPESVNGLLRMWVQQELLAQEALARGLDKYPAVQRELDMWYSNFLEQSMRFYLKKQVKVSDAEVLSFMQSADSSIVIPRVRIRELKTASLDDMNEALEDLKRGKSMEEVIDRWGSDPDGRQRKGISEPFSISDRYPVGEIASHMLVGQRFGPLKEGHGYLYFELIARDSVRERTDLGYVQKKQHAANELLRQKEKRLLNVFIAQAGESRGYMIFQDRLSRIAVSPIPMMTFRILGFGGRMFAVPFVDRQIDWLNVEPPKGKIVF